MASLFKKKSEPRSYPITKSGCDANQGRRLTMEDTHVAFDDINAKYCFPKDTTRAFYGVYDGHGGRRAAEVAEQFLHDCVMREPAFQQAPPDDAKIKEAMRVGFKKTDDLVLKRSMAEQWNDGATAACAVVLGNKLHIANLGDAEIVVGQRNPQGPVTPICVSLKHKPNTPDERQRIEKAGGHVLFGRILGSLAVSRSFGDTEFKFPQNKGTDDFVSCDPYTNTITLTPDNQFMIIACDGLWDKTTYEEAVVHLDELKKSGKNPTEAAQALVKRALDSGTLDNVTCIVVYLQW